MMAKPTDFEKRARVEFAKLSNDALFEYLISQNRHYPIEKIAHQDVALYDFWLREELANRAGDLPQEPFGIMRFHRGNPLDSDADGVIIPDVSAITEEGLGKSLVDRFNDTSKKISKRPTMADLVDRRGCQVFALRIHTAGSYTSMPLRNP
ncbi:hypothetical protein [Erythrobacter sp. A6_0]|uniref:hypothetical protein n=1 Tax=Erythrobacter sp. A6_0 TaxID=2821089 RepID=UPI001ADD4371|nr:hypothetical protein [Erythrobacter sp. A6_0]MBO9510879.1 hypothetical protein [Erythrobacter sp. A6_0]